MSLDIDFHHSLGNSTSCDILQPPLKYWVPVVLKNSSDGIYQWSSDTYPKNGELPPELNWETTQPNSYGIDKCVYVTEFSGKYLANDDNCESRACTVCEIPDFNYFYLRGEGPEILLSSQYKQTQDFDLLDRIYSIHLESQTNASSLVFEGQNGLSQITWIT